MHLLKKSVVSVALAALVVTGVSLAVSDGGGDGDIEGAHVVFTVDVPPGSTTYSYKVYDSDLISDDLLEEDDFEPIPGHKPGEEGNTLDQDVELKCIGGEVTGGEGSSGESTAEVYVVFEFNNGGGKVTTKIQKVSCPD